MNIVKMKDKLFVKFDENDSEILYFFPKDLDKFLLTNSTQENEIQKQISNITDKLYTFREMQKHNW